jgi:hypothetical protein
MVEEIRMKQKVPWVTAVVLIAVASLGGCDLISRLFPASDEAEIISFTVDGIIGTATIKPFSRTVTLLVEPMDLSSATPGITVSRGASVSTAPLADGQAVAFHVTGQNGDVVLWAVTAAVQHGISYDYTNGPTRVVLTEGLTDSQNAANNLEYGNGEPWGIRYPTFTTGVGTGPNGGTYVYSNGEDQDVGTRPPGQIPPIIAWVAFPGSGTGNFDGTQAAFQYTETDLSNTITRRVYTVGVGDFSLSVSAYGNEGGDIIGTFSGTAADDPGGTTYQVTNGFFKVYRLVDDTLAGTDL